MNVRPAALHPPPRADAAAAIALAGRLREGLAAARARPLARTVAILDEASARLADRATRDPMAQHLAPLVGHDVALIHEELDVVAAMLARPNLERMVKAELGEAHGLDAWDRNGDVLVRRQPRGVVLHNLAGNALIVAPNSIALGLLTKSVNLIKASSDEPRFAAAFAALLIDVEPRLRDELTVCTWPGGDVEVYRALMPHVDAVLHWGGEESRASIATLTAPHDVALVAHGPKLSFGLVQGLRPQELPTVADGLARDVVLWEQRACASPRFVAVLPGQGTTAEDVARALAGALAQAERMWPSPRGDSGRAARHAALRQRYAIELELEGRGKVLEAGSGVTVILADRLPSAPGIDHAVDRLVWVADLQSAEALLRGLDAMGPQLPRLLQVLVQHGADGDLLDAMAARGVARIEAPGRSSTPSPGASHDGLHDLAALTRLVTRSQPRNTGPASPMEV